MTNKEKLNQPSVTIICQLFYPELISTGQSMTELAEEMIRQGSKVNVICGPPTVIKSSQKVPSLIIHEGIHISRVWGTQFSKLSFFGKLFNQLSFTLSLVWRLVWDKSKSPLLLITNPPFLPFFVSLTYPFHKRKMVLKIADLYPDTLVACNVLPKNSLLVLLWSTLNRWVYRRMDHIIVLGRCMKQKVMPYISLKRLDSVSFIPIWGDDQLIQKANPNTCFFKKWGLEHKFICLHAGNMGRFHDLKTFVNVAKILQDQSDICFVFVGDGHQRKWLEKETASMDNIIIKDYVPREQLGEMLCSASLGLVSLRSENIGCSVPSKTFGLLAAGLPILGVMPAHSEIAMIINENELGYVFQPEDTHTIATTIKTLASSPKLIQQYKKNATHIIQNKYSLKLATTRYLDLFKLITIK